MSQTDELEFIHTVTVSITNNIGCVNVDYDQYRDIFYNIPVDDMSRLEVSTVNETSHGLSGNLVIKPMDCQPATKLSPNCHQLSGYLTTHLHQSQL